MTITINDKEYLLQWGMGALEIYCDTMECDLDGLSMIEDTTKPLQAQKALVALISAALKNGCDYRGEAYTLPPAQLKVYLDEAPQEKFTEIMDDFANSRYLGKTVREHLYAGLNVDNSKKKENPSS